jgi:hypothetical protein
VLLGLFRSRGEVDPAVEVEGRQVRPQPWRVRREIVPLHSRQAGVTLESSTASNRKNGRSAKVKADEGFGAAPEKGDWTPMRTDYPRELGTAFKEKTPPS